MTECDELRAKLAASKQEVRELQYRLIQLCKSAAALLDALHEEGRSLAQPQGNRCPHDGGKCHHNCTSPECYRAEGRLHLTTPWPGYPLDGYNADGSRT